MNLDEMNLYKRIFGKRKAAKLRYKQQALFYEAVRDIVCDVAIDDIRVDHSTGRCFYAGKEYPIIFPLRYLREIESLDTKKDVRFNFLGTYTRKRDWINKYASENSVVCFTSKGRTIGKSEFDRDYYQLLCRSEFTLCPSGDFKWTYRFFEAIMARSIPIVDSEGVDESMSKFKYFIDTKAPKDYVYDIEIVKHNYRLFIENNTFIRHFVSLNDLKM